MLTRYEEASDVSQRMNLRRQEVAVRASTDSNVRAWELQFTLKKDNLKHVEPKAMKASQVLNALYNGIHTEHEQW